MQHRSFVTSVLALLVVLCSGPFAWAISPQPLPPKEGPFWTGLFAVTAAQAIRVSVLHAGVDGGIINPCFEPEPFVAKVAVRGLNGATLFESLTSPLLPGTGSFVDFTPLPTRTATLITNRRLQVRVEVSFSEEDVIRAQESGVILTLEVFDIASGRTEFTMPFAALMFNPQPEPPEPVAVP